MKVAIREGKSLSMIQSIVHVFSLPLIHENTKESTMFHETPTHKYGTDQQQTRQKTHRQLNPANIENSTLESSEIPSQKKIAKQQHTSHTKLDARPRSPPSFFLPRLFQLHKVSAGYLQDNILRSHPGDHFGEGHRSRSAAVNLFSFDDEAGLQTSQALQVKTRTS